MRMTQKLQKTLAQKLQKTFGRSQKLPKLPGALRNAGGPEATETLIGRSRSLQEPLRMWVTQKLQKTLIGRSQKLPQPPGALWNVEDTEATENMTRSSQSLQQAHGGGPEAAENTAWDVPEPPGALTECG